MTQPTSRKTLTWNEQLRDAACGGPASGSKLNGELSPTSFLSSDYSKVRHGYLVAAEVWIVLPSHLLIIWREQDDVQINDCVDLFGWLCSLVSCSKETEHCVYLNRRSRLAYEIFGLYAIAAKICY